MNLAGCTAVACECEHSADVCGVAGQTRTLAGLGGAGGAGRRGWGGTEVRLGEERTEAAGPPPRYCPLGEFP